MFHGSPELIARMGNFMYRRGLSTMVKRLMILIVLLTPSNSSLMQTDNCCFVDRQCVTDEEWTKGYYAFQNGQCDATSRQQATPLQSEPQTETSEDIDNCCFIGWQCDTNWHWTNGYWAFQNDQCAGPEHATQTQLRPSQPEPQNRQEQDSQQEPVSRQESGGRQESDSRQEKRPPDEEDSTGEEPSGDLIFEPLTEEEWRNAYCDIFGCDE